MQRADAIRLKYMLDAAQMALKLASGKSRAELDADVELTLAMVKAIEMSARQARSRLRPGTYCRASVGRT